MRKPWQAQMGDSVGKQLDQLKNKNLKYNPNTLINQQTKLKKKPT